VGRTKTGDGWTVSAVFQRVVPCLSGAQSMEAVHCAVVGAPSNTSHGDICSDEEGNQAIIKRSTINRLLTCYCSLDSVRLRR
jgi:hypothetical protein